MSLVCFILLLISRERMTVKKSEELEVTDGEVLGGGEKKNKNIDVVGEDFC